jgi:DNA polymerase-3 subunit delta'
MPLADVRGQDDAVAAIRLAWSAEKLHHAILLDGPSGVGKTMLARELARMLLCQSPAPGPDACGACRSCQTVERGVNPDLLLVRPEEGRAVIGVAQIRDLRLVVDLPPHGGRAKAVVIDDADRMTPEAQNALLKTLEEPPSRTFLLLTTSRAQNLLPTVRSRCSRLRLAPLATDVLEAIVSAVREGAPPESARLAAALAQGSVTRALDLLDTNLEELLGLVVALHGAVEEGNGLATLALAEDLARSRDRMVTALELLALWYRDVMGMAADRDAPTAFTRQEEALRRCGERIGVAAAAGRVSAALEAIEAVAVRTANARLTAEAMLLRMLA